jgi:hypothetical protein
MKQIRLPKRTLILLLMLALSLTGCANNLPVVSPSLALPAPPPVVMPTLSVSYSESVQLDLQRWQKMLTDTPLIPEPTNVHGLGNK